MHDLGSSRALNTVKLQQFDDAIHHYDPDSVKVWTGDSPVTMTLQGETWTPSKGWFDLALSNSARYVRLEITKANTGHYTDYLFLDEVTVT